MIDILKHPVLKKCCDVSQAIEECGASEKLTIAVLLNSELTDDVNILVGKYHSLLLKLTDKKNPLSIVDLREYYQQYEKEEISLSRFRELIDEHYNPTRFKFLEYVKIIPLEGLKGRIVEVQTGQSICYKIEYWVDSKINVVILYEDEIEKL